MRPARISRAVWSNPSMGMLPIASRVSSAERTASNSTSILAVAPARAVGSVVERNSGAMAFRRRAPASSAPDASRARTP